MFIVLFCAHLFFTSLFRFILTTITAKKVHQKKIKFNTLIIGSNIKAVEMYKELENQKLSSGYNFIGFVSVQEKVEKLQLKKYLYQKPVLETNAKSASSHA